MFGALMTRAVKTCYGLFGQRSKAQLNSVSSSQSKLTLNGFIK